jgi:hypothetical protein
MNKIFVIISTLLILTCKEKNSSEQTSEKLKTDFLSEVWVKKK